MEQLSLLPFAEPAKDMNVPSKDTIIPPEEATQMDGGKKDE